MTEMKRNKATSFLLVLIVIGLIILAYETAKSPWVGFWKSQESVFPSMYIGANNRGYFYSDQKKYKEGNGFDWEEEKGKVTIVIVFGGTAIGTCQLITPDKLQFTMDESPEHPLILFRDH
jgi:hypothetical protein